MSGNNMEVQADFDDLDEHFSILRAIHMRQKRYNFKNPLETLKNYKERVLRDCKKKSLLTESFSVPRRNKDIQVSGSRCVSVDIRNLKAVTKKKPNFSSSIMRLRPKLLPMIMRPGILNINNTRVL